MATTDISSDCQSFLLPLQKKYPLRLSIHHWQLRDLILCPFTRDEIFYVHQNNILRFNPYCEQTSNVMKNLPFSPISFAVGCGYMAAGGQHRELAVRNLNSSWSTFTELSGTSNNAIQISQHLGLDRLVVCNNDQTVKVFSLPDLKKTATMQLPVAVNHASVSPNGKQMVVVGDSRDVFMFDIMSGGYHHTATLQGTNCAGFNTCWSKSGDKFAVASQDGQVTIWDTRNSQPLTSLGSSQPSRVKGAVRCVKFSQTGAVDLLAYSEHTNYINIVDARTFEDRQSICISPESEHPISGLTFSPCSTRLFVGLENHVAEFEVDVLARHRFAHGSLA